MATEVLNKGGTQICFADHAGDFSPASGTDQQSGSQTNVQFSMASTLSALAIQSAKVDLGTPRPAAYEVMSAIEFSGAPTDGNSMDLYWAPSISSVSGNANPGGVSGIDLAYEGYSDNMSSTIKQLDYVGSLVVSADATPIVIVGFCGVFSPTSRDGTLVLRNQSATNIQTDDVECHIVFNPIVDEVQ